MEFRIAKSGDRGKADAAVIPVWQVKNKPVLACSDKKLAKEITIPLSRGDFKAEEGETFLLYLDHIPETRVLLIGLGGQEKLSVESLRRAYSMVTREAISMEFAQLSLYLPDSKHVSEKELCRGIAEGLSLANYQFKKYITKSAKKKNKSPEVTCAGFIQASAKFLEDAKKYALIAEAVHFARDLVNSNADEVTPQYLAQIAAELAKKYPKVKATLLGKKEIAREKMGLLLAVNRASPREPAFIVLEYKGNSRSKDNTVLVGKGITYDTGGLNLKPTGSMETMKSDMAGGAACLGTILAAASLQLPVNVTVVIAATENCIGGNSIKPGDVFTSMAGKTVEINNTDAEGRLVLADALAYVEKYFKPARIIDIATLTGAIEVALGSSAAGLFTKDDALAGGLIQAGNATQERVWHMPLFDEYNEAIKSDIADLKNTGGRAGGACIAAAFLSNFVTDTPWAHLDIAGVSFLKERRHYMPKYGNGYGVRLLLEFLESLTKK